MNIIISFSNTVAPFAVFRNNNITLGNSAIFVGVGLALVVFHIILLKKLNKPKQKKRNPIPKYKKLYGE